MRNRRAQGGHVCVAVRCYHCAYGLHQSEELLPQGEKGDSVLLCLLVMNGAIVDGSFVDDDEWVQL